MTVLRFVRPLLRRKIALLLPVELGQWVRQLQRPFQMSGEFAIRGTSYQTIVSEFGTTPATTTTTTTSAATAAAATSGDCDLVLDWTSEMASHFVKLQRSMCPERNPITSFADVLPLMNRAAAFPSRWEEMLLVWREGVAAYLRKVPTAPLFSFDTIANIALKLHKKPLFVSFRLQALTAHISITNTLKHYYTFARKNAEKTYNQKITASSTAAVTATAAATAESAANSESPSVSFVKPLSEMLCELRAEEQRVRSAVHSCVVHVDEAACALGFSVRGGERGRYLLDVREVFVQLPPSLTYPLPQLSFGPSHSPVPFFFHITPKHNGRLAIKVELDNTNEKAVPTTAAAAAVAAVGERPTVLDVDVGHTQVQLVLINSSCSSGGIHEEESVHRDSAVSVAGVAVVAAVSAVAVEEEEEDDERGDECVLTATLGAAAATTTTTTTTAATEAADESTADSNGTGNNNSSNSNSTATTEGGCVVHCVSHSCLRLRVSLADVQVAGPVLLGCETLQKVLSDPAALALWLPPQWVSASVCAAACRVLQGLHKYLADPTLQLQCHLPVSVDTAHNSELFVSLSGARTSTHNFPLTFRCRINLLDILYDIEQLLAASTATAATSEAKEKEST